MAINCRNLDSSNTYQVNGQDVALISDLDSPFLVLVEEKSDFPAPSGGVITLGSGVSYLIVTDIDLTGDRLVADEGNAIIGTASGNASLTSTGLAGDPLIYSENSLTMRTLTVKDVPIGINVDGSVLSNTPTVNIQGINFVSIPEVGTFTECANFLYSLGAMFGSKGIKIVTSIDSFVLENILLAGDGLAGNMVEIPTGTVVNRRIRITDSAVDVTSPTVGLNVNAGATIGDSDYILERVNFDGTGTFLVGLDETSDEALFTSCSGIVNTSVNGQIFMQANATATVIALTNTFVKVAGTTTASADNSKYTATDNRLTNDTSLELKYLIQCTVSFTAGNNEVCEFGFFDSKLAAIRTPSRTTTTANSGGRAENVTFNCVVQHSKGDYLEIHVANTTATTNITVTEMNFVITESR